MDKDLPLSDHLTELRRRLIVCLSFLGVMLIPAVYGSAFLLRWLMKPLSELSFPLYLFHVTDGLMLRLRLGLLLDFVAAAPLLALELGLFLRPGLLPEERRKTGLLSLVTGVFFTLGVFCFFRWLAPGLTALWAERMTGEAMLSAGSCSTLWLLSALICGILAALPPLLGILVHRHRRKEKETP